MLFCSINNALTWKCTNWWSMIESYGAQFSIKISNYVCYKIWTCNVCLNNALKIQTQFYFIIAKNNHFHKIWFDVTQIINHYKTKKIFNDGNLKKNICVLIMCRLVTCTWMGIMHQTNKIFASQFNMNIKIIEKTQV